MRRIIRDENGFTVVELMVALSIVAMAFVVLMTVGGIGKKVMDAEKKQWSPLEDIANVRWLLIESLERTVIADDASGFVGDSRSLKFLAQPLNPIGLAMPVVMNFSARAADGRGLRMAIQTSEQTSQSADRTVLPDDLKLEFSYFSPSIGWSNEWRSTQGYPLLVRTRVSEIRGTSRWDIVASVRTLNSIQCKFESARRGCGRMQ